MFNAPSRLDTQPGRSRPARTAIATVRQASEARLAAPTSPAEAVL